MFRAGLVALSLVWALCAHGKVLYTGSSTPGSQGWFGPIAGTQTLDPGGFVTLDTTASGLIQGGYGRIEPLLDSSPGFRLDFTARVISEAHDNNDRAGIYRLGLPPGVDKDSGAPQIYAVNPPFLESRLEAISERELQEKLRPIRTEVIPVEALQHGGKRMDLALPLLALLIVTLLLEGWLSQRF